MLGHHSQGKNKNYLKVARDKLPPKAKSEPDVRESTDLERRCAEWVKCGENREKPLGELQRMIDPIITGKSSE